MLMKLLKIKENNDKNLILSHIERFIELVRFARKIIKA